MLFSAIVGTILVLINQGDQLYNGNFDQRLFLKIVLTYTVPFMVSTISSIQALSTKEKS